jgi:hypothetical protein
MLRSITTVIACAALAAVASGCGSSAASSSVSPSTAGSNTSTSAGTTTGGASTSGASALSAEATSAATGDIPDNQMFLTYRSPVGHYTMSYPEGWAIKAHGSGVTISDKNNIVHVVVASGTTPSAATVAADLTRLKRSNPTLTFSAATSIQLKSGGAIKTTYTTRSAPNPVTGKSVLLIVDRYELGSAGRRATVDLGTPKGVDNVDAYHRMINSFRWQ